LEVHFEESLDHENVSEKKRLYASYRQLIGRDLLASKGDGLA
jgi:hypothetical protein